MHVYLHQENRQLKGILDCVTCAYPNIHPFTGKKSERKKVLKEQCSMSIAPFETRDRKRYIFIFPHTTCRHKTGSTETSHHIQSSITYKMVKAMYMLMRRRSIINKMTMAVSYNMLMHVSNRVSMYMYMYAYIYAK